MRSLVAPLAARFYRGLGTGITALCLMLLPALALSHSLNDSYLQLSVEETAVQGSLQVAVTDMEIAVGLDEDGNGQVTWGEILGARAAVDRYLLSSLVLTRGQQACALEAGDYRISQQAGGAYLDIALAGRCPESAASLGLDYQIMFDLDSSHRGIVSLSEEGDTRTAVLSPTRRGLTAGDAEAGFLRAQLSFIVEGIWHIWIGIDHILFLMAMLFGVVIHRRKAGGDNIWRDTGMEIFKLVTAFTVAHSVTLLLASLQIVSLPGRFVEAAIALTVIVSGINIVIPLFRDRHWQVAFVFGLIHGFGFANVLAELDLSTGQFIANVLSFNVGVELGQLVIVLATIPVLILLTSRRWSQQLSAIVSGPVIAQIGIIWFLERSLG